jgi:hypothetical protein
MNIKYENELREFADNAQNLAKLIYQEWASGALGGGFQTRVNVESPAHGPNHALLNIERQLGSIVTVINDYCSPTRS